MNPVDSLNPESRYHVTFLMKHCFPCSNEPFSSKIVIFFFWCISAQFLLEMSGEERVANSINAYVL